MGSRLHETNPKPTLNITLIRAGQGLTCMSRLSEGKLFRMLLAADSGNAMYLHHAAVKNESVSYL